MFSVYYLLFFIVPLLLTFIEHGCYSVESSSPVQSLIHADVTCEVDVDKGPLTGLTVHVGGRAGCRQKRGRWKEQLNTKT